MNTFLQKGVPLIVGEFAADHGSSGDVAETAILAACEEKKMGYIGWSWSGNSAELVSLDIVDNFDANSLSAWGDTLFNDINGISVTAEVCTVF